MIDVMKSNRFAAYGMGAGAAFLSLVTPAFAATATVGDKLGTFMNFLDKYVIPIIFAIAFIVFIWGVFQYFIAGGANDENRSKGRQFILWGIIGFVLMFSIWGIVGLLQRSLGFDSQTRPPLPCFNGNNCNSSSNGGTTQSPVGPDGYNYNNVP